jgi:hypothetical protein
MISGVSLKTQNLSDVESLGRSGAEEYLGPKQISYSVGSGPLGMERNQKKNKLGTARYSGTGSVGCGTFGDLLLIFAARSRSFFRRILTVLELLIPG